MPPSDECVLELYRDACARGPRPGETYRHYATGNLYEVVAVCLREADLEPCVVYRCVETGVAWVRTLANFTATVRGEDGRGVPRFSREGRP